MGRRGEGRCSFRWGKEMVLQEYGWLDHSSEVGNHLVYGCVAWFVFHHCQRWRWPTACEFTLLLQAIV